MRILLLLTFFALNCCAPKIKCYRTYKVDDQFACDTRIVK